MRRTRSIGLGRSTLPWLNIEVALSSTSKIKTPKAGAPNANTTPSLSGRLRRRSTIALPASHYGRPWLDVLFEDGSSKGLAFGLAFALPNAVHILTIDLLDGHVHTTGFEADYI